MRIENCTLRVNKHSSATEVFITNEQGINTVLYLPPDTEIDPTQPLEFIPVPPSVKDVKTENKPSE